MAKKRAAKQIKSMDDLTAEQGRSRTYDVWTHGGYGVGWWLHEKGYDNLADAGAGLAAAIKQDDVIGGAITPAGVQP